MTRFSPTLTAQITAVGRRLAARLARPVAVCGAVPGRCAVLAAVADYRERLHRARAQRVADVAAQADARSHGGTR